MTASAFYLHIQRTTRERFYRIYASGISGILKLFCHSYKGSKSKFLNIYLQLCKNTVGYQMAKCVPVPHRHALKKIFFTNRHPVQNKTASKRTEQILRIASIRTDLWLVFYRIYLPQNVPST